MRASVNSYPKETDPGYVDWLKTDNPIPGQAYTVMSFLDPREILKQREEYDFEQFVKQWQLETSMSVFVSFLNFISAKYSIKAEQLMPDFEEFVQLKKVEIEKDGVSGAFQTFMEKNHKQLRTEFESQNKFRTSIYGMKISGTYGSHSEAQERANYIRQLNPAVGVSICDVGTWVPFAPKCYQAQDTQYMNEELNELHHQQVKTQEQSKILFEGRVAEAQRQAVRENLEAAKKYKSAEEVKADNKKLENSTSSTVVPDNDTTTL